MEARGLSAHQAAEPLFPGFDATPAPIVSSLTPRLLEEASGAHFGPDL
jgi:hypothetical protein